MACVKIDIVHHCVLPQRITYAATVHLDSCRSTTSHTNMKARPHLFKVQAQVASGEGDAIQGNKR
jgi:hypothetical protein